MIFFFKREFCIIYRKEVYNGALDLATTSNPKKDEPKNSGLTRIK